MQKLAKVNNNVADSEQGDEIIGVKVMSLKDCPKPKSRQPTAAPEEEENKVEPAKTLPDPKKLKAKTKTLHKDD